MAPSPVPPGLAELLYVHSKIPECSVTRSLLLFLPSSLPQHNLVYLLSHTQAGEPCSPSLLSLPATKCAVVVVVVGTGRDCHNAKRKEFSEEFRGKENKQNKQNKRTLGRWTLMRRCVVRSGRICLVCVSRARQKLKQTDPDLMGWCKEERVDEWIKAWKEVGGDRSRGPADRSY